MFAYKYELALKKKDFRITKSTANNPQLSMEIAERNNPYVKITGFKKDSPVVNRLLKKLNIFIDDLTPFGIFNFSMLPSVKNPRNDPALEDLETPGEYNRAGTQIAPHINFTKDNRQRFKINTHMKNSYDFSGPHFGFIEKHLPNLLEDTFVNHLTNAHKYWPHILREGENPKDVGKYLKNLYISYKRENPKVSFWDYFNSQSNNLPHKLAVMSYADAIKRTERLNDFTKEENINKDVGNRTVDPNAVNGLTNPGSWVIH